MVRTASSLFVLVLCLFALVQTAQAQEISPRSYLFVEVVDPAGQAVPNAKVRLAAPEGKELVALTTNDKGLASSSLVGDLRRHHYDLQITSSRYQRYDSVLFPKVPDQRYLVVLTEDMPSATDPTEIDERRPFRFTLRPTPTTPAEGRAADLEARKRQLLLAAKRGDAPGLRTLLREGVGVDTADARGVPAVAWATFAGDPETIKLLLEAGANVRGKANNALLLYLAEGVYRKSSQANIVDKLIAAGASVSASSPHHGTVLTKAIIQAPQLLTLETIRAMVRGGADVNAPDPLGQTPLMLAVRQNQKEVFDFLLNAGAKRSLQARDKYGRTVLAYAASAYLDASLPMVNVLLASGAIATEADTEGATPLLFAARGGSVETIQVLLTAGASIQTKDKLGVTALMYALREPYTGGRNVPQTVKFLLTAGAKINDVDASGRSALMYAASSDLELVNLLIANGANVNLIDVEGQTALLIAVKRQSPEIVKTLLDAGAASTINTKDKHGRTALLYAVDYFREDIALALITAGANVNDVNENNQTPLIVAVLRGFPNVVKLLLERRASLEITDNTGSTALMYAKYGEPGPGTEIFNSLVAAGASLSVANNRGETPLMVAAGKEYNVATVRQLLATEAKATINARNLRGETALIHAAAYSDAQVVSALLAAGANATDVDSGLQTPVMRAVERYYPHLDLVKLLLQAGVNANARDSKGRTALLHLPYLDHDAQAAVFKELIAAGADVNAADAEGLTVLMSTADRNAPASLQMALAAGAAINAKDRKGRTALFYALSDRSGIVSNDIMRTLIAAGANVNVVDESGDTPLMLAAHQQSLEAVTMLLAAGADTNVKNKVGGTALMRAAKAPHYKDSAAIIRVLVAAKASVNEIDQAAQTALMFAARTAYATTVQELLDAGASVNLKDEDGKTALLHAAEEVHNPTTASIQALIAAGANVNEVNGRHQTPLMLAALRGSFELVELLLKAGAAVNTKDEEGLTPLMSAAWGGRQLGPEIGSALLKAGARVNDVDKDGKTALMYAAERGAIELMRLLLHARASINARNKDDDTALIFAIKGYSEDERKVELVRLLLRSGANVTMKNKEGQTPLTLARKNGQTAIVKLIEESQRR